MITRLIDRLVYLFELGMENLLVLLVFACIALLVYIFPTVMGILATSIVTIIIFGWIVEKIDNRRGR